MESSEESESLLNFANELIQNSSTTQHAPESPVWITVGVESGPEFYGKLTSKRFLAFISYRFSELNSGLLKPAEATQILRFIEGWHVRNYSVDSSFGPSLDIMDNPIVEAFLQWSDHYESYPYESGFENFHREVSRRGGHQFPKSPSILSRKIRLLTREFFEIGFKLEFDRDQYGSRIKISKTASDDIMETPSGQHDYENVGNSRTTIPDDDNDVMKVLRLTSRQD